MKLNQKMSLPMCQFVNSVSSNIWSLINMGDWPADMDPITELETQPEDVAEACLLPFKMSKNSMPIELTISTCKNYKK